MTVTEFRFIEAAIERMLKDQYLEQNEKIEEALNDLRIFLRGKVKIKGQDIPITITFPTTIAPSIQPKRGRPKAEVEDQTISERP